MTPQQQERAACAQLAEAAADRYEKSGHDAEALALRAVAAMIRARTTPEEAR